MEMDVIFFVSALSFPHVVEFISLRILSSLPYFELDTFIFCKTFPFPPSSAKKKKNVTKCNNFFF